MNHENKPATLREIVYQANPLIQACRHFDLVGTRLFYMGLMALNPHLSENDKFYDEKFPETFIPTATVARIMGNDKCLHGLKDSCDKLFNSSIALDHKDGGWELLHIFDTIKYVEREGLHIKFDERMKPYLLNLLESKGYTIINITQIFKLSSPYAIRLLELMLQYRNMQGKKIYRNFDEERLRFALNVPEWAYTDRPDNFRRKVLSDPIAEINRKTDFHMEYQVNREGRKVIDFTMILDISGVPDEVFDMRLTSPKYLAKTFPLGAANELAKLGFKNTAIWQMEKECQTDKELSNRLEYALQALDRYKRTHAIKNELGFLRMAIADNWYGKKILEEEIIAGDYRQKKLQSAMELEAKKSGVNLADFHEDEIIMVTAYANKIREEIKNDGSVSRWSSDLLEVHGWTIERFKQVYMKEM